MAFNSKHILFVSSFSCIGVICSNIAQSPMIGRNPFEPCPEPHESLQHEIIINKIVFLELSSKNHAEAATA